MLIERRFHLDKVASSPASDCGRPIIEHISIEPYIGPGDKTIKHVAVASDGYVLAVVPVVLAKGETPGLLYAPILRNARRQSSKHEETLTVRLSRDTATLANGTTFKREEMPTSGSHLFPDWRRVVALGLEPGETPPHIALNLPLVQQAAKGIGTTSLCLRWYAEHKGVVVTDRDGIKSLPPKPPFAVVMPMYVVGDWGPEVGKPYGVKTPEPKAVKP